MMVNATAPAEANTHPDAELIAACAIYPARLAAFNNSDEWDGPDQAALDEVTAIIESARPSTLAGMVAKAKAARAEAAGGGGWEGSRNDADAWARHLVDCLIGLADAGGAVHPTKESAPGFKAQAALLGDQLWPELAERATADVVHRSQFETAPLRQRDHRLEDMLDQASGGYWRSGKTAWSCRPIHFPGRTSSPGESRAGCISTARRSFSPPTGAAVCIKSTMP